MNTEKEDKERKGQEKQLKKEEKRERTRREKIDRLEKGAWSEQTREPVSASLVQAFQERSHEVLGEARTPTSSHQAAGPATH